MDPAYRIDNPDEIFSPAFVIFRPLLLANLDAICRIAGDLNRLRPHVKTHKIGEICKLKLARGITKFKVATIAEAEMMAALGAPDVFLAYNMIGPNIRRITLLCGKYPATKFHVTADDPVQLRLLSEVASSAGVTVGVLLDVNPGRDRTGLVPGEEAAALYRLMSTLPGLRVEGLHVYDGHRREAQAAERRSAVMETFAGLQQFTSQLERSGLIVPRLVCGGTPTFPIYSKISDPRVEFSPGTCLFQDAGYGAAFPDLDMFQAAALVFTRVVSRPTFNRITFDAGSKALAADPPLNNRLILPDIPDAKPMLHNEEHLVVETEHASRFRVGDWTLALPVHVCPTPALYSDVTVIENGQVVDRWPVTARNRVITV